MIPPDLLDDLKAWLGIAPGDTTQDAWLTAECEVVLAAMRSATGRWLYPPANCDDGFVVPVDPCNPCHPRCGCGTCPPVKVRQVPATELRGLRQDGADLAIAGYLLEQDGTLRTADTLAPVPVPGRGWLTVAYVAGYAELPAELKSALFNLVGGAWNASGRGQAAGVVPTGVAKMSIIDVGSIEYADPSGFAADGQPMNPILGRYAPLLAPYVDLAGQLGGHPCRDSRVTGPVVAAAKPRLAVVP